jgi:voltage-dependent calcium channel T type alpha-1G
MLFGILGTNYFKGTFFSCNTDDIPGFSFTDEIKDVWTCFDYGGTWLNKESSFDNTMVAIMTLFEMSTTEGWIGVMWSGVDSTSINN